MSGSSGISDFAVTRRKFLYTATTVLIVAGGAAALWPAIDHMNPDASAMPERIDLDLSSVQAGQAITVRWRTKPIFIRHRTPDEIQKARMTPVADLRDADARVMPDLDARLTGAAAAPLLATDENRTKPGKEDWLIVAGLCTHENCILLGQRPGDYKGDYGGWFCPCCASHYDTAGRFRLGLGPANLPVPPYRFMADKRIRIG